MMQLFLEPIDVWLFRDGKPFDALSDHRARSLFPPYPNVVQGVVRSHHLVVKGLDFSQANSELRKHIEELVGTDSDFKNLKLRGPFIARRAGDRITPYFPVPVDVVLDKEAGGYCPLRPRVRQQMSQLLTSAPDELPMLLWAPEGSNRAEDDFSQWMAKDELLRCLRGGAASAVCSDELFVRENRFGIVRNDERRTTEEGALYEVEFIRPCKNVGLWVQIDGYDGWRDNGLMRMGGEGRGARFEKLVSALEWPLIAKSLPSEFKVYFATPTYFTGGWKPNEGWGKFFDGEVKLQAVALNRYETIGGFDWASSHQKPAQRYVPAGSVYYFQHDGSVKLKADTITDYGAEIGFGQVIITE